MAYWELIWQAFLMCRSVQLIAWQCDVGMVMSSFTVAPSSPIAPKVPPLRHQAPYSAILTLSFPTSPDTQTSQSPKSITMSFLRSSAIARSAVFRPAASTVPRAHFHAARRLGAQGDYGSGDGNPAAEKPQQQGKAGREDLEHPGPPPPKVGQNNKTSPDSPSPSSSKSSSSGSKSSSKKSESGSTDKDVKGKKGAQPKILNENPPKGKDVPEDVKQHNKEMENRSEKAHEQVSNEDAEKDKVSKSFWKGE